MGLVRKKSNSQVTKMNVETSKRESANSTMTLEQVLADYRQGDARCRREKAKVLREFSGAHHELLALLVAENESVVRDALLNSLASMAQKEPQNLQGILVNVVDMLRHAEASLRTQIIRFVTGFPEAIGEFIPLLLADPNGNIRLYTLDIMQTLAHPKVPEWLKRVIEHETEANVVISAIDRSVEAGCRDILDVLPGVAARFPDVEMMPFAIKIATERLEGAL